MIYLFSLVTFFGLPTSPLSRCTDVLSVHLMQFARPLVRVPSQSPPAVFGDNRAGFSKGSIKRTTDGSSSDASFSLSGMSFPGPGGRSTRQIVGRNALARSHDALCRPK